MCFVYPFTNGGIYGIFSNVLSKEAMMENEIV